MNEGVSKVIAGNPGREDHLNSTLAVPVIVNASFACERFLKSMLPDGTHGHELDKLLSKLDQENQNKIIAATGLIMKCSNPDYTQECFWKDLKDNSNNFVSWRYFHEGRSQTANL